MTQPLKATWTMEAARDLEEWHNFSPSETEQEFLKELQEEIDKEILADIRIAQQMQQENDLFRSEQEAEWYTPNDSRVFDFPRDDEYSIHQFAGGPNADVNLDLWYQNNVFQDKINWKEEGF